MDNLRLKKIAESYHHALSHILLQDSHEPLLDGVHVTHVKLTPDLRLARVYFNMTGGRARESQVIKGFKKSKGYLKKELASRINIRYTPDLEFFFDEAEFLTQQVDDIFKKIDEEKNKK